MIVLTVDWTVAPEKAAELEALLVAQAKNSLEKEPGCLRFEVSKHSEDAGRFFLYEVYADDAAFAAHPETAHFAAFLPKAQALNGTRDRQVWRLGEG